MDNLVQTAKTIRKQLKSVAPCTKFSVTIDRFSMGEAIRIVAMDEMRIDEVQAVRELAKSHEGESRYITTSL